jgi:hypothetical protein
MARLRDLSPEERREKMQEMQKAATEAAEKFMKEHFKPEQTKRMKEITLQQGGLMAFNNEEVQKQLKLTDEQKDKIRTLAEDFNNDRRELFQGGGEPQENMRKMQALSKEYLAKAVQVLNDDQKAQWKEMTGKPFELRMEFRRQDR